MSASSPQATRHRNGLYRIAALSSAFVGLFFCAGAVGHISAAWSLMMGNAVLPTSQRWGLLLPGLLLAITALVNLCSSGPLWVGRRWVVQPILSVNLLAAFYLSYLLHRGVLDHPIGEFLVLVASHGILLGAIKVGLTWPAEVDNSKLNTESSKNDECKY